MKRATKTIRGGFSLKINNQKSSNELVKAVFTSDRRATNVVVSISPEGERSELLVSIGESFEGKLFEFHFPISERLADAFVKLHKKLDKSTLAESEIATWLTLFIGAIGQTGSINEK